MKLLRFLGILLVAVVVVLALAGTLAFAVATSRYEKTWTTHDATFAIPFPLSAEELASLTRERLAAGAPGKEPLAGIDLAQAANDSAVARGAHLVNSWVGCSGCHGPDLGGNVIVNVPIVGYWAAPNLTLGRGSVTTGFTAHDWDRAVRHAVRHNGHSSSMPSADLANLSDHELSNVVSYIRSLPPIDREIGHVKLGPVFVVMTALDPGTLSAFKLDHQKAHAAEPPAHAPTPELGEHISQTCRGCHGDHLSGGKVQGDPNMPIVANITPDATGLKSWSEADFVRAMREGKRPDGSAISKMMPWESFGQMDDIELAAVWAYLRTVPAMAKGNH